MAGNHRSGRRPAPTRLRILRGGKQDDREPQPTGRLPACPDRLTGAARQAWISFAAALDASGVGTSLDATALELLADSYGQYLDAAAKVAQAGAVWVESAPKPGKLPKCMISPWTKVMRVAWQQVERMLLEFGMTPSARAHVKADRPAGTGDDFNQFVSRER
jgi:P27 family predicted phage terminase small subunit